jgi:hypothetical protein
MIYNLTLPSRKFYRIRCVRGLEIWGVVWERRREENGMEEKREPSREEGPGRAWMVLQKKDIWGAGMYVKYR